MFGLIPAPPLPDSPHDPSSGPDLYQIEMQSDGSYLQWRYKGFNKWNDIISIKDLKGAAGPAGKDGKPGDPGAKGDPGIDGIAGSIGAKGPEGQPGPIGAPGIDGLDGKDGKPGKDGQAGKDAKNIELGKNATHIQWRYVGDAAWQDLVPLAVITGPQGKPGERGLKGFDGAPGARGPQGFTGPAGPPSGADTYTFETVSKNIRSWDAVFGYTGDQLTTITYTNAADTIVKTFNYTGDKLTSLVLSGDTPSGIELTKTLSYTGDQLTGVNYS